MKISFSRLKKHCETDTAGGKFIADCDRYVSRIVVGLTQIHIFGLKDATEAILFLFLGLDILQLLINVKQKRP